MNGRAIERLDRSEWGLVAALSLVGLGVAAGSQVLVVSATLPLWYVAAAVFGSPQRADVELHRQLSVDGSSGTDVARDGSDEDDSNGDEAGPNRHTDGSGRDELSGGPGDTVTVRTTVENAGSDPIVDLRVVDGVPDALPVISGSPRGCVTLEPDATVTIEYAVELRRGEHTFDDTTVRTRDLTGTVVETWTPNVAGSGTIRCSPAVETVDLGDGTNDHAGEVQTDEGGSGVEFYAVREYQPGDSVGSIDWRRYARSRELATVEYRAERATRVVCVVDTRPSQSRAATTEHPPAIELSVMAAERTVETLLATGYPTGVATVGGDRPHYVPPGTGPETQQRAMDVLPSIPESGTDVDWRARLRKSSIDDELPQRLPGETQVYLFSSFVDDEPVDLVKRLRAHGYAVRVVSPDVTDADDIATRLEALDRGTRLARVRATGARVIDWQRDRPLGLMLYDAIKEVGDR